MNVTPINSEAEFLSVCSSVSNHLPRLLTYLRKELEKGVFRNNTKTFLERQKEFQVFEKLETLITNNAIKFGE